MLPLLFALAGPAAAQDGPPVEVGLRGRTLHLPGPVLNGWLTTDESGYDRPKVGAWAAGLEVTIDAPGAPWTFYLEYIKSTTQAGYWDDVDDPPEYDDGQWIQPSNVALITLGADVGHEFALTSADKPVWLGLVLGGGLGLGVRTGTVERWYAGTNLTDDPSSDPGCLPDSPAYDRYQTCASDGIIKAMPVVPMIDANLALKLNITEHAWLRLDGGLHTMLYGGFAVGAQF